VPAAVAGAPVHPTVLPLQVVGYVQFRPIGKSHFVQAPWSDSIATAYLPSAMTRQALINGVAKAAEPLRPFPEERLVRMKKFLTLKMSPVWFGDNVTTYEDSVDLLNMEKSAGYPYYYGSDSKAEALLRFGDKIRENVKMLLVGDKHWVPFTLTLKDELRLAEKVACESTRPFAASGLDHLLASKVCFAKQNEKIVANLGKHPITLGIQVPGPNFVRAVLSLGSNAFDADGSGTDQRFNLGVARVIRDVRKEFLPKELHACVDHLYDSVYCGHVISEGVVYQMMHNKSGWENTSMDTSLYFWCAVNDFCQEKHPELDMEDWCRCLINGDDLAISFDDPAVTIADLKKHLEQFNVRIEFDVAEARSPMDIVFLSHHLRERRTMGSDIVVAAGNRGKLLSSRNWIRVNDNLSFEESCVAHLLGLRLCLWPWYSDFADVNELLDDYLSKISITPAIRALLAARLTEGQLFSLHTKVEGRFSSEEDLFSLPLLYGVDCPLLQGAIKVLRVAEMKKRWSGLPPAERNARLAQSKKDRSMAGVGNRTTTAPVSSRTRSKTRAQNSGVGGMTSGAGRQTAAAAAYSSAQSQRAPRIQASRDNCRIVHRELIGSVVGSAAFAVPLTFAVNPGLPASFPWLSTQAQAWETYRFNKLRYCYYTRTGTGVPGSCMLVPDYDAEDSAPISEQVASSYEDVEEDAPWKDICCELRPSAMFSIGPKKFVRTGAVPAGTDVKTYDAAQLFVCTTDGTAVNWGKLWVEYDVEFFTPQINPAGVGVLSQQHLVSTVAPTTAANFGAPVSSAGSANIVSVAGNVLTFNQAGQFNVVYQSSATTSISFTGNPVCGAGASFVTTFYDGNGFENGGGGTTVTVQCAMVKAVVGSTLTFDNTYVLGLQSEVEISQVPANAV